MGWPDLVTPGAAGQVLDARYEVVKRRGEERAVEGLRQDRGRGIAGHARVGRAGDEDHRNRPDRIEDDRDGEWTGALDQGNIGRDERGLLRERLADRFMLGSSKSERGRAFLFQEGFEVHRDQRLILDDQNVTHAARLSDST